MATLTVAPMDPPYETPATTTAFRIIESALQKGHAVNVFAYEGAVNLAMAGQAPHANPVKGTTAEEQDDTILWLNHMLKNNGLDVTILLRANAVNYLVKGQDASGLKFGTAELPHPPVIDKDVSDLIEKGVPVYYVKEDVDERGVPEA